MRHTTLYRSLLVCAMTGLLAACSSQPAAPKSSAKFFYVDPASVKLAELLPKPGPDKSPITRGEGDLMLAIQAETPPAARDRAKSEDTLTPWVYAGVLGPNFSKAKMPLTADLLDKAEKDTHNLTEEAKRLWDRDRPPHQDGRITPLIKVPSSASYPSGHATRAVLWARVLAVLSPKDKEALLERARLVALDRVIAGVHYPTDVAAGMALGDAIADQLIQSEAFKTDLEKAKAEWPSTMKPF
jgi:acid phosphatase (class A)